MTESNPNAAGLTPEEILLRAADVILPSPDGKLAKPVQYESDSLRVGVDLGTAYTALVALDKDGIPLAGEYLLHPGHPGWPCGRFYRCCGYPAGNEAQVEARLNRELTHAASGFPPGVPQAEVRAAAHVVETAGMDCPN